MFKSIKGGVSKPHISIALTLCTAEGRNAQPGKFKPRYGLFSSLGKQKTQNN